MDERQNIALACRFIPYDQWLVTRVDTSWTISQLKSWFIAKCISTSGSTNFSASSLSLEFPFLHVPPRPRSKPPRRPTSPIIFAPEPKGRPISPIRFAPLGSPKPASSSDVGLDGSSEEEGTTIAMGYEEDDEFGDLDSDGEHSLTTGGGKARTRLGRTQYLSHFDYRPGTARSVAIEQAQDSTKSHQQHQQPVQERQQHHKRQERQHHSRSSAVAPVPKYSTYDVRRLMLIRFSTGQVLEDHFRVDDCSLSPYELIEIHRVGEVLPLPRTIIEQYVQPYWEGWVKSLRVVAREPTQSSKKHKGKRLEKERENEDGTGAANRRRRTKLDWRDRWVFVKDGVLNLRKDRSDPNTAQLFPLDSLIEIRGSEQIGRSITATSGNPPSQQRIICAKFRSRTTVTRFADQPVPDTTTPHHNHQHYGVEPQSPPFKLSSPFNASQNVWSPSVSKTKTVSSARSVPSLHHQPPSSIHTKGSKLSLHSTVLPSSSSSKSSSKPKIKLEINQNTSTGSVESTAGNTSTAVTSTATELSSKGKGKGIGRARVRSDSDSEPVTAGVSEPRKRRHGDARGNDGAGPSTYNSSATDEGGDDPQHEPEIGGARSEDRVQDTHPGLNLLSDDHANTTIPSHPIPHNPNENDPSASSSDSGSLSSPVFAHSDVDSDVDGSDVLGGYGWAYSYGYGFDRGAAVRNIIMKRKEGHQPKCAPLDSFGGKERENMDETDSVGVGADDVSATPTVVDEDATAPSAGDSSFVVIDASVIDEQEKDRERDKVPKKKKKEKGSHSFEERPTTAATVSTIRGHTSSRPGTGSHPHSHTHTHGHGHGHGHTQRTSESEWIVLDLGDDHAYKSFLRILHRHAPHSIFSSFLQSLSLSLPAIPALPPASPSTPNPTPIGSGEGTTPDPSPIVFAPAPAADPRRMHHHHRSTHSYEIAAVGNPGTLSPSTPDHRHHPNANDNDNTTMTTPRDSETFPLPDSEGTKLLSTFGALAYPEWRLEIVIRARKSGMGGLNRAMEMFLWGDIDHEGQGDTESGFVGGKRTSSILSMATSKSNAASGTSEEESLRRKRKKRAEVKKTVERENLAIGLERTESGSSAISKGENHKKRRSRVSSVAVDDSGDGEGEAFYSADEGSGTDSTTSNPNSLQGLNSADSDDSGEESSDAEWMGWMADLYRQTVVYRDNQRKKKSEDMAAGLHHHHRMETNGQSSYTGWVREDDYRLVQRERMAFEPSATVIGPHLLPAAPVHAASSSSHRGHYTHPHTTAQSSTNTDDSHSHSSSVHSNPYPTRLSSPSSNESLGRVRGRRLSFGMSPLSDAYPSSSTSAVTTTATASTAATSPPPPQSASPRSSQGHSRSNSQRLAGAMGLSHFASSGIIGAEFREREFGSGSTSARRPSMPTLNSGAIYGDSLSSSSPQPSVVTFRRDRTVTPPAAGSATLDMQTPAEKVGRRSSLTMGLGAGSLGRSSSRLRKREKGDGDGDKEREKEKVKKEKARAKEEKEKEKERKGKGKEKDKDKDRDEERAQIMSTGSIGIGGGKRRPRLSLSTGSRQNLNATTGTPHLSNHQSPPQSPPPPSRGIIRRMRSSSSLMLSGGEGDGDGGARGTPVRHVSNPNPTVKKKAGIVREVSKVAEKWVQGLESALDFVDGRQ